LVALLTACAPKLGTNSRYLVTLSLKPRPALDLVRARLGDSPVDGLAIEWPPTFPGRARNVITRSGRRRRYIVPCFRHGDREAHGEAVEEAAAFILLDACPGVEFQEQPARFTFQWCGKTCQHFPDLLVASNDRVEFWECKRAEESQDFWIKKRTERLQELLAPLHIGYRVVSGLELFDEGFLDNAKRIRRFAKHSVSPSSEAEARAQLDLHGALGFQQLAERLRSSSPTDDLMAMIYRGNVVTNMGIKLTRLSQLYTSCGERRDPWVWQLFDRDRN
jgi:hypothetical protein